VFERHKLGASSSIAATLEVDGDSCVLRGKLGDMLNDLLGRQAVKVELQVHCVTSVELHKTRCVKSVGLHTVCITQCD
jgi:hypothetical protein